MPSLPPTTRAPLAPSPELYGLMVESVSDYAIFALDRTGHIVTWNRGAKRLKGYDANEIVGRSFEVFYPPEALASGFPRYELEMAIREGRFEDEGWRIRKDGSRFWARVIITALRNEAGELVGFAKITGDLSARREAEERLRRSEEGFRLLVQAVQDYAILMLDPDGRVVTWNEGAERIQGYRASDILGRSFETFYPPEAVASGFPRHELDVATREGRFEDEGWRVRNDGTRFWANVVITALRDRDGRLLGFSKVTRDLTSRREAEDKARQLAVEQAARAAAARRSEELEELNRRLTVALDQTERARRALEEAYRDLDQFAYIASHDLKAPLRGIASLVQWIGEDLASAVSRESERHMRLLQDRVQRMQALIDGILAYSRAGRATVSPELVDTGKLVKEVIDLQALEGVRIDIAAGMPVIEAERVPLQQVFMNLIGNAVKFSRASRSDPEVSIGWRDLGNEVEFSVSDNGPGIAPEYHTRIFALFQTVEVPASGEGSGIGLALVKKIVERRGGHVAVESAPGQGATFRVSWPKLQPGGPAR